MTPVEWRNGPLTVHGRRRDGERVAIQVGQTDAENAITMKIGKEPPVDIGPMAAIELVQNLRHFIAAYYPD